MSTTASIDLMGATYPDVPAVTLPTHEGGTATFWLDGGGIDGDNLAYGGAYVGTAIVGTAAIYEPALVGTAIVGSASLSE